MTVLKRSLYILIFISSGYSSSFSQTIINAERVGEPTDSAVYSIAFSYNGTRGNSNVDQLSLSPVIKLIRKKNDYKLFGGYSILSDLDNSILNNGYVHIRHNYKISKRLQTFEFYQIQFNEVLLLEKREAFGLGLKYGILEKDSLSLYGSLGIMHEFERLENSKLLLNEISVTNYYRGNGILTFNWLNSKFVSVHNVVYYQPRIYDFKDFRLLNEFNLVFKVTKHLDFLIEFITRFDSKPPVALREMDHIMNFGVNVKF